MWYRSAPGRAGIRRSAAAALGFACAWLAGMQGCDTTDHSGESALLTVTVDSGMTRFSRLIVILRDTLEDDTLWRDSLPDPARLRRLPTRRYRSGPVQVLLQGFAGGLKAYEESRRFDPAARTAPRDTLIDLSAPLARFAFDTPRVLLPFGKTAALGIAILPAKADGRLDLSFSDSGVVTLSDSGRGADGIRRFGLTPRKAGSVRVIAIARAGGKRDTVDIQVSRGTSSLLPPVNQSEAWSTSARPTWNWKAGGPGGSGFFSVRIDEDALDPDSVIGDTTYTSPYDLDDGEHTLYVWARDLDGHFSPSTGLTLRIDTDPPEAPKVSPAGTEATDSPRPSWSWVPQGEGMGSYRVRIDSPDLETGAIRVDSARYTSRDSLAPGPHVLRVQERDSAGNWSPSGQATVTVVALDRTPPNAPTRRGGFGAPAWHDTLSWRSGGRGGAGVFRYLIDKADFAADHPIEIRDSAMRVPDDLDTAIALHHLRVQERDAVGNWSETGEFAFVAAHFSFLLCVADTHFVLTVAPDSTHLALSLPVRAPANDSEMALQRRQLWHRTASPSIAGGERWTSPFLAADLRFDGLDQPPRVASPGVGGSDSAWTWIRAQVPFVGGTPPPWYSWQPVGVPKLLTVSGGPIADSTSLGIEDFGDDIGRQYWRIETQMEKWWIE
jgi:hypothetical protein